MAALTDYLAQITRQAIALDDAADRDYMAERRINDGPPGPAATVNHTRRVWTRMDRRRIQAEYEFDSAWGCWTAGGKRGPCPVPPTSKWYTRREVVLRRLPRIEPLHQAALAEAQRRKTYTILAPLIAAATQDHKALLAAHADCTADLHAARERQREAVERLRIYLAPAAEPPVALPNEARDRWLYERALKGIAWKRIKNELAKKGEWDPITTIPGLRLAAARYQKAHPNLPPIPRRQRGRKATRQN